MNVQATITLMNKMKLEGMANAYQAIHQLPINNQPTTHESIANLVDPEMQSRASKRTNMLIRLSRLRYKASLHDIKYNADRNIDKQTIASLADCSFIDRSENLFITGATGCGKSFIACAIGYQACLYGHRTLYFNMNRLCEQIAVAKVDGYIYQVDKQASKGKIDYPRRLRLTKIIS